MKKLTIFLVLVLAGKVFAQLDASFSMSYTNQMFFNPATIGSRNCVSATASGRFQWVGISNAPITWAFGVDVPLFLGKKKLNGMGFGIVGYGDYMGYSNSGGLRFGFNYRRYKLGPGDLSIGIDMGLGTKKYINAPWVSDPWGLPDPNGAGDAFDMGIGVYYSGDNFYTGISCTHLNGAYIPEVKSGYPQTLYVNGGGFIPLGTKKNWRLNPNLMFRTEFSVISLDAGINALCFINENHGIMFGLGYRLIDAIGMNLNYAIRLKGGTKGIVMIGYDMDVSTLRLGSAGATSHEVVLRFCFPKKDVNFQKAFF